MSDEKTSNDQLEKNSTTNPSSSNGRKQRFEIDGIRYYECANECNLPALFSVVYQAGDLMVAWVCVECAIHHFDHGWGVWPLDAAFERVGKSVYGMSEPVNPREALFARGPAAFGMNAERYDGILASPPEPPAIPPDFYDEEDPEMY